MKADRLLATLLLLQSHGRLSSAELARRLEVSERTVRRDVDALSAAGVPVFAERGRNGGYQLVEGYRTDATGLTSDEARALFLFAGGSASELGLAGPLDAALRKLVAALPAGQRTIAAETRERLVVDPAGWTDEGSAGAALATIGDAVLSGRRLRLRYRRAGAAEARERIVDPYGLVQAAGVWYLIAATEGEPRAYRVSRVVEAAPIDEQAVESAWLSAG